MKKLLIALIVLGTISIAEARNNGGGERRYSGTGSNSQSHHVNGYTRRDGTQVAPHHSTNPNHTKRDNYNTNGNYNPHNGKTGTQYVDR